MKRSREPDALATTPSKLQRRNPLSTPSKPSPKSNSKPSSSQHAAKTTPSRPARTADQTQSDIEDEDSFDEEDEEDEEDELLQRDEDEDDDEDPLLTSQSTTTTTTKPKRGRPKGWRKQRTPTPPPDLPACEYYFFANRPGAAAPSNHSFDPVSLLDHEEYAECVARQPVSHAKEMDDLQKFITDEYFDDWVTEIEYGFNVCLYGFGSKKRILDSFLEHYHTTHVEQGRHDAKIVVASGFRRGISPREILNTILSTIPGMDGIKLPAQLTEGLDIVHHALETTKPNPPVLLALHSMDAPALRKGPIQSLLADLVGKSKYVSLIASVDTMNFPLLWDDAIRMSLNFLSYDVTTMRSFGTETEEAGGSVVEEVNTLLSRGGRRIQGKEGVLFVLKSLTESARRLFGLLLSEVLSTDVEEGGEGVGENEEDETGQPALPTGTIEYRSLYRKAVTQLIASNEMIFRQLLKEFYDHEMIGTRRDAVGAEWLGVPFRREECQAILEDLVMNDAL